VGVVAPQLPLLRRWSVYRFWLAYGMKRGWVSAPYCMTHDGNYSYMTDEELAEWEEGGDPCHTVMSVLQ